MVWCPRKQTILQRIQPDSISLSPDGLRMAVFMKEYGVRMLQRSSKEAKWNDLGSIGGDLMASSPLSGNGNIIATADDLATTVYKFDGTKWQQLGNNITTCESGQQGVIELQSFGTGIRQKLLIDTLCLNDTAKHKTQFYELKEKLWKPEPVVKDAQQHYEFSEEGNIMVRTDYNQTTGEDCLKFYNQTTGNEYSRLCSGPSSVPGLSALSGSGKQIAIPAFGQHPIVYKMFNLSSNGSYVQYGSEVQGDYPGQQQLSYHGDKIFLGQLVHDNWKIFKYQGNAWKQEGSMSMQLGEAYPFTMSSDGNTIAIYNALANITNIYDYIAGDCSPPPVYSSHFQPSSSLFSSSTSCSLLPILAIMIIAFCFFVRRR